MKKVKSSSELQTDSSQKSDIQPSSLQKCNPLKDLAAAITFFTRLPVWKVIEIPAHHYKQMIYFWPLTGWLTSGVTVLAWYCFSTLFPTMVAIILSFVCRIMFSGGLHEDGLGDFFDGFGGGRTREDILRIMKDSHAGSYSVIGLILYYLLLITTLSAMPPFLIPVAILSADPFARFLSSIMMNILPYARPEEESKIKIRYDRLSYWKILIASVFGLLPLFIFLETRFLYAVFAPVLVLLYFISLGHRKISGYTGDMCGASALLCELAFYLALLFVSNTPNPL